MKIGLVDVDNHNWTNLALMKISSWHKASVIQSNGQVVLNITTLCIWLSFYFYAGRYSIICGRSGDKLKRPRILTIYKHKGKYTPAEVISRRGRPVNIRSWK